ncbi:hypothetical protein LDENG_00248430 [Lucifuga dentata]|nr:hypothetical protein LDENG_00248430 [Lucifuga dentata]
MNGTEHTYLHLCCFKIFHVCRGILLLMCRRIVVPRCRRSPCLGSKLDSSDRCSLLNPRYNPPWSDPRITTMIVTCCREGFPFIVVY